MTTRFEDLINTISYLNTAQQENCAVSGDELELAINLLELEVKYRELVSNLVAKNSSKLIPQVKIQEIITDLREKSIGDFYGDSADYADGYYTARESCADRLEELLK